MVNSRGGASKAIALPGEQVSVHVRGDSGKWISSRRRGHSPACMSPQGIPSGLLTGTEITQDRNSAAVKCGVMA